MSRVVRHRADAGFTLIELLVALAIIGAVLAAIGTVVTSTVRGARTIQDRLAAGAVAESLLASLSDRQKVRVGSSSGETAGFRWTVTIAPIGDGMVQAGDWRPCGVAIEVRGSRGPLVQLASIVLVPRATS